ncbi:hypothetical protein, partial [Cellulosimicrobium sp. CUA-896]|uniref:hypothetical protein n=1 Tax=Cellulosimicrobium sp. CUA-896 TaxID=1517881 RepID=UPI001C9E9E02
MTVGGVPPHDGAPLVRRVVPERDGSVPGRSSRDRGPSSAARTRAGSAGSHGGGGVRRPERSAAARAASTNDESASGWGPRAAST